MTASWILQGLLAVVFLGAGTLKLVKTREDLVSTSAGMAWAADFKPQTLRGIGALEVMGAIGLVVPALSGVLLVLTPIAAGGLVLMMLGAALTHGRRREYGALAVNVVLGAMALAVVAFHLPAA